MSKNIWIVYFLAFGLIAFNPIDSLAQKSKGKDKKSSGGKDKKGSGGGMSKEEQTQWKAKYKEFNTKYGKDMVAFREYVESKDAAEKAVPKLQSEVDNLKKQQDTRVGEIDKLRTENDNLKTKVKSMEAGMQTQAPVVTSKGGIPDKGVAYAVQIGAYRKINMDGGKSDNFTVQKEGDLSKYLVGVFDNYQAAEDMKNNLRKMGMKDAFVVAFRDGARVDVKDVMNNTPKK